MGEERRGGMRKKREKKLRTRIPEMGYYFIVTDTNKTEENYMKGLRESIPSELQSKLVIKVIKTQTQKLVEEAKSLLALQPQYGEPWIVFDRDQVKDFDKIIENAGIEDVKVAWSNPCIEIWFSAYFGSMPAYRDSVACCKGFSKTFKNRTGREYKKSSEDIYKLLFEYGDESQAVDIANQKLSQSREQSNKPSDMCPATTLHLLIQEIKNKVKQQQMR